MCAQFAALEIDQTKTWVCICYHCRVQFELPLPKDPERLNCPDCNSRDIKVVVGSSCVISSSKNIESLMWDYVCHNCRIAFEKLPPNGPKEEKVTECPECNSRDVQRITSDLGACLPGG